MKKTPLILFLNTPEQKQELKAKRLQTLPFIKQMRLMYPQGSDCLTLVWGYILSCRERKRVIQMAENLNIGSNKHEGANWIMAVMALETGGSFDHKTDNGIGYVGLVQFGKDAAKDLGTTQTQLVDMTRLEQLDYVEKWFNRKKDKIHCLTDLYLSVLLPNLTGKGKEKYHVIWTSDREAYYNNPSFHKEDGEYDTTSHRGKYDKKGKKVYKRGFTKKQGGGTTYMWEVTQEIERWYNKGVKNQNNCNNGSCTLSELQMSDPNTIFITRKSEVWTGNNSSSMTLGTFTFGNMQGYICEPHGEETTQSGKDKRVPAGEYNIKWNVGTRYTKDVYTKEGRHGKKHNLDFPELEHGFINLYNDKVPRSRGILMHAGTNGGWTTGCILVNSSIDKGKKKVFDLKQSVTTIYKIFDLIDERGIDNVKIIIKDEIE